MLRLLIFLLAPGLLLPAHADDSLQDAIAADYGELESLYQHLHRNPELSYQEQETAARLAKELKQLGYKVTSGVGGHGVVAVMTNGDGPTLMIRADMDALPVAEETGLPFASQATAIDPAGEEVPVMHACGHDVHMTTMIGTARQMARLKDQWQGTLVFIAQPAEEVGGGAKAMLGDGLFTRFPRPDYLLALHVNSKLPAGTVGYHPGFAMANVDSVDITVQGIGGHGASPQNTKDPVVIAAQIILQLQTIVSREISPLEPAVITVGSIHGGTKHNVIGDEVKLQLTVRSYSDATRDYLLRRIAEISEGVALTAGLEGELLPRVSIKDEYTPALYNDPAYTERVVTHLRSRMPEGQVVEVPPVMGGEDFGRYSREEPRSPGLMLWLGVVEPARYAAAKESGAALPSTHSPIFAPDWVNALPTGVYALTETALMLLAP